MKYLSHKRPYLIIIAILVAATFVFFLIRPPSTNQEQHPAKKSPVPTQEQSKIPNSQNPSDRSQPQLTPQPSTPACKLFTDQSAQQILGSDTSVNINESIILTDTADMQTSACVYTNATPETIRLEAYIARTALGRSANAVEFGSGRPAEMQNMPEYGQAAFWNNSTGALHVLKNNNRYIISRTKNNLSDTKTAANIIVPKL
jgi:hypothetical protein